jgi:hypothetical protein
MIARGLPYHLPVHSPKNIASENRHCWRGQVTEIVLKEYGVVNRPKRFGAKLRAERKQAEAAAAEGG